MDWIPFENAVTDFITFSRSKLLSTCLWFLSNDFWRLFLLRFDEIWEFGSKSNVSIS